MLCFHFPVIPWKAKVVSALMGCIKHKVLQNFHSSKDVYPSVTLFCCCFRRPSSKFLFFLALYFSPRLLYCKLLGYSDHIPLPNVFHHKRAHHRRAPVLPGTWTSTGCYTYVKYIYPKDHFHRAPTVILLLLEFFRALIMQIPHI